LHSLTSKDGALDPATLSAPNVAGCGLSRYLLDEMMMLAIDSPVTPVPTAARAPWRRLTRSALLTGAFIVPALVVRVAGLHPDAIAALLIYGAAVVAASFLLAWAAEAAQIDVSGGLAIAILAVVAVGGGKATGLALEPANRVELGFLLIAGVVAFLIPATGHIHLVLGLALLGWFGFYLYKLSRGDVEEPELIGTAAALGELPDRVRRIAVIGLFATSCVVILLCAEPFANNLVSAGTELGIDRFLLVQWLAPLASEAPEFIIATIFATRGKGTAAIATLISSKVNQWTLLIGSLPVAHLLGGGGFSLALDSRQVEEVLLTATQTLMGVALVLALRFRRPAAWALLGLFLVQFPIDSTHGRLLLCGIYAALAVAALIINRRHLAATMRAPFVGTAIRHGGHPHQPLETAGYAA
jgi:cation:H+ antiporter